MGNKKYNKPVNRPLIDIKLTNKMRKISLVVLMSTLLFTGTGFAKEGLHDQYHVYAEGEYLGSIADPGIIKQVKEEKKAAGEEESEDLDLVVGRDISVVKEKVFGGNEKADDEAVAETLSEAMDVETEAVEIRVGGEALFHVKDVAAYDRIMRGVRLAYMTEEELLAFEEAKETGTLPEMQEGMTQITDLSLQADLQAEKVFTVPENVLSEEDAIKRLLSGKSVEQEYGPKENDTISSVAEAHDMSVEELLELNPGMEEDTELSKGDKLKVTVIEPYVEVSVTRQLLETSVIPHEKTVEKEDTLELGKTKVKQEGKDGRKETMTVTRIVNGDEESRESTEDVVEAAVEAITLEGTKVIAGRATGKFTWPAEGGYISSKKGPRWGRQHNGIDIARPSGMAILAADGGKVIAAGTLGGFGNRVEIDHGNGYTTLYAHLSSIDVKTGQQLAKGQKLGNMGSTGNSTGVHLHFEVRKNGALINPLTVISQ